MATSTVTTKLLSVDFEVFGKVQGVFFRKYTQQEGTKLKLVGWVMNTEQGTVVGQAQGKEDSIKKMKEWLKKTGSPKSKIEKCEFKSEREIKKLEFNSFDVRK
jgi:acylphosphatase